MSNGLRRFRSGCAPPQQTNTRRPPNPNHHCHLPTTTTIINLTRGGKRGADAGRVERDAGQDCKHGGRQRLCDDGGVDRGEAQGPGVGVEHFSLLLVLM